MSGKKTVQQGVDCDMAEWLYAQRLHAGEVEMPSAGDPTVTKGVKAALAVLNNRDQVVVSNADDGQPLGVEDGRDLVNQLLGQAQAADAIRQISQTIGVSKLAYVKETKLYRSLKGMPTPNRFGELLTGTWEEFCGLLGISDEKANQDIANLRAFGEGALDAMTRMGIGYRELRQYRQLPADERVALIEAAKEGDKDALLDLAETLIAKHTKEKEAADATIQSFEARVNGLQSDLNTAQDRLKAATKELPPPFLSREADAQMQRMLSHEAMGAAGVDLLARMLPELAAGGEHLPERMLTMHSCLTALLSRITLALVELDGVAGEHDVPLPERPQMVLSESLARDYLAAHTGYVETAIELAQKALIGRQEVTGRARGRPVGSTKKSGKAKKG